MGRCPRRGRQHDRRHGVSALQCLVPGGRWALGRLGSFEAFQRQPKQVERARASWPRVSYLPGMPCGGRRGAREVSSPGNTSPHLQSECCTLTLKNSSST
jgi:hypothetical protein